MGSPLVMEETRRAHALLFQRPRFSEARVWEWVPAAHGLKPASGDSSMRSSSRNPNPQVPQKALEGGQTCFPIVLGTFRGCHHRDPPLILCPGRRPRATSGLHRASLKPASEGLSARKPGAGVVSTVEGDPPSPTSPWVPCFSPRALSSAHNLLFPTSHSPHCCQ